MKKVMSILIALMFIASFSAVAIAQETFLGKFEISDIMEYKALPNYIEPEALELAVAKGELPPVWERLPKNPQVINSKAMTDGVGVYGDKWRVFCGSPTAGWNWAAGLTSGWWGTEVLVWEGLVEPAHMWMLKNPIEPVPNLATSWEWSEDGKTLTMHLLEGAKWSDGVEFTADDVLFTYYDCHLDSHIPSFLGAGAWTINGKLTELEKVDKYTIRWRFGAGFPLYILFRMGRYGLAPVPKHVLAEHHPKYNPDATYEGFIHSLPPEDLPVVTLGPWVPVKFEPARFIVARRNPYYWKVDEKGQQLPYFNEAYIEKGRRGITRTLNVIAGSCDYTNLETPGVFSFALEEGGRSDSYFAARFVGYNASFSLQPNLSLYKGVKTERDRAMRELFRDLRFRKALSYAINREGITNSIFPGPLIAPYEGSLVDSSAYYDPDAIVSYAYDLEKSKGLFAELGFKDIDGDGIMEWATGTPLAGQDLTLVIHIIEDETAAVNLGEALVPYLREAGIKSVLKVIKGTTFDALSDSGELEIPIERDNVLCLTPLTRLTDLGPVTEITPTWHQAGPGGERDLFPFEARLRDLINSLKTETSGSKVRETFSEIQHLWTENVYKIGLYKMQVGNAIANRLRNVPPGTPPYMYEWFDVAQCAWQLWVPKEEQKPEILPGVIPTYEEK